MVSYKYPGIPQENRNLEEATTRLATAKYLQKVRQDLGAVGTVQYKRDKFSKYIREWTLRDKLLPQTVEP